MSTIRYFFRRMIRWGWFGALVLFAFAYLAAGLSSRSPFSSDAERKAVAAEEVKSQSPSIDDSLMQSVALVDAAWAEKIDSASLDVAPQTDWLTICRRLSLALVGNGLSLEEIRELERLPDDQRVDAHLNNLLRDSRYHDYWAQRWTRFLVGTDGGEFIVYRRRRFRIWLTEQLAANRRYDRMVNDLITAEGLWTDKPQVNFLTATFDSNDGQPDPIRLAARTSRVFLGLRIDCLQCHDDFMGNVNLGSVDEPREGMQTDFHQLAAFYTSAETSGLQGVVENDETAYQYKYLNATEEVKVEPAVPYAAELLPAEGRPRERLAQWVTHPENRQAARAAVSHVWALLFGRSIGDTVDNLPLDEAVHPMLVVLADDFVKHDFDMRRLIRVITRTQAFRADSRAAFEVTERHEQLFAAFPLVQLRPEQVARSVIQAARIKKTDRESSVFLQLQTFGEINDFVTRYGDQGEDQFTTDNVTITQRLLMMNGNLLRESTESNPVLNASAHIQMFTGNNELAVESAYLCALNRYPNEVERNHFVARLDEADDRNEAIEDLLWSLLNSSELSWNH